MKIVYHFKLLSYAVLILIFAGCIKEDLEICLPQTVHVGFAFIRSIDCPEEIVNPEDVNRLTVFVFDERGRFLQQVDTIPSGTDYGIELSLVPAHYQLVAVAGYDDDQLRGAPFVPGVTHVRDAAVATYLEQRDGSLQSADYIFYNGSDTLTVVPETPRQEYNLPLIQRTKALNITVDGLNSDEGFLIALEGNAAHYTFDDQQIFLIGNPLVYVELAEGEGTEDYVSFGRTQINWPLLHDGFHTRLQVINPETGHKLINENLYELLERVPGLDPECANSFDVDFVYTVDMKIRIYINKWLVSEGGYELQ